MNGSDRNNKVMEIINNSKKIEIMESIKINVNMARNGLEQSY